MHILYLITSSDQGGAQRYVLELARHFKGSVAAGVEQNWLEQECKREGIPFLPIPHLKRKLSPLDDLRAFFELYRIIRAYKPDIVHTNSEKMGVIGGIAARLAGAKVVFTAHGMYYFTHPSPVIRWCYAAIEWCAGRFHNRIIAVSEYDRQQAIRHHLGAAQHIMAIHNAITPPSFLSPLEARAKLGLEPDSLVIGCIANYYHRKGLDILLDALGHVSDSTPLQCVLIGDGPERHALEAQATRLNLSVRFTGQLPQANQFLRAFDIFVLPSRYEGFPYVLLEALAAGLAIIATNVGGNTEAVGTAGSIVPPQNPAALSAALAQLCSSADLRAAYAVRALAQANLFTTDRMLSQTTAVYQSLASH